MLGEFRFWANESFEQHFFTAEHAQVPPKPLTGHTE
jgi:hypothetical protein